MSAFKLQDALGRPSFTTQLKRAWRGGLFVGAVVGIVLATIAFYSTVGG